MRAARYHAPKDVRIEDVPEPEAGPGQVKIRVAANGICGSDLHEYFNAPLMVPTAGAHPLTGVTAPVVLGHEFSGTVVALGDGVSTVAEGDRVAVRPTITCGQCAACRAGLTNVCQVVAFHGLSAATGGLAEYSVVDAGAVHRLPAAVDVATGALVEPMAVAHHAAGLGGVQPGQLAVVAGLGPIGIGVWLALRAAGVTDVVLSDPSAHRRSIVTSLGAEHVVDPTTDDLGTVARDLSGGRGAEAFFDAAGVGAAVEQGIASLAPRGRLVVVGLHEQPMSFWPTALVLQELVVLGSGTYLDEDFTAVVDGMAAGAYPTEGWVEHAPLDQLTDVLDRLRSGDAVKVLVDL